MKNLRLLLAAEPEQSLRARLKGLEVWMLYADRDGWTTINSSPIPTVTSLKAAADKQTNKQTKSGRKRKEKKKKGKKNVLVQRSVKDYLG
jgi:hypothetical protein